MTKVKFNSRAYCKMILHAAKYPHCSVSGVLLAKNSEITSQEVEFVDCIPLFHICINLTPMAEIALMQIDEISSKKGLTMAGYYVAPDNLLEDSFEKANHRIADKIAANCVNSCIVLVNSTTTSIRSGKLALKVAQYSDGNLKPMEQDDIFHSDDTINASINLLENDTCQKLMDYDNHLDDIKYDWLNLELNKEIDDLL